MIVPKSTLGNWMNEFRRFCPTIRTIKFHGNAEQRQHQRDVGMAAGAFDVCVTSYEMVIKERNHLKRIHWRYIIIDEAHRIKNEKSMLSQVQCLFGSCACVLLFGVLVLWLLVGLFSCRGLAARPLFFQAWYHLHLVGSRTERRTHHARKINGQVDKGRQNQAHRHAFTATLALNQKTPLTQIKTTHVHNKNKQKHQTR